MSDSQELEVQYIEDMAAATEYQLKHSPNVVAEGAPDNLVLSVSIGLNGLEHPQTEEHYFEWIAVYFDGKELARQSFAPTEAPVAVFELGPCDQQLEVRALCNLHGVFGVFTA